MPRKEFPDLHLDLDDPAGLVEKAVALALELRPGWTSERARSKRFSGGVSNILVGVYQVEKLFIYVVHS